MAAKTWMDSGQIRLSVASLVSFLQRQSDRLFRQKEGRKRAKDVDMPQTPTTISDVLSQAEHLPPKSRFVGRKEELKGVSIVAAALSSPVALLIHGATSAANAFTTSAASLVLFG